MIAAPAAPCLDASYGRLQGCSGQDLLHGHGHLLAHAPDVAWAIQERDAKGADSNTKEGHLIPVAFSCKDHGADAGETAPTLRAMNFKDSHANAGGQVAIAFESATEFLPQSSRVYSDGGVSPALQATGTKLGERSPQIFTQWRVRRLTPEECEALQGFPRGYTNIPWGRKPFSPDGPRYRSLGNTMAANVMRWIGFRIQMVDALA